MPHECFAIDQKMEQRSLGFDVNYPYYRLWLEYNDAGPSPMLISCAVLLNVVVVCGIAMNLGLICTIVKNRSLHGTSSALLALTALFEVLHESGHLLFLFVSLSGLNFLPYAVVFKFLAFPLLGCAASLASIALTGLDRLLQITFSNWHDQVDRKLYIGTFTLFSLLCGFGIVLKYGQVAFEHPTLPQSGTISDIFIFDLKPIFFLYMLITNLLAIGFYLAIWKTVKREQMEFNNERSHTASSSNRRLFKSLAAIISITIGSYLLTALVRLSFLLFPCHLGQIQIWLVELFFGILLNLGVTLNVPVLFVCSSEYRRCFKRELARLFPNCAPLSQNANRTPTARPATKLPQLRINGRNVGQRQTEEKRAEE